MFAFLQYYGGKKRESDKQTVELVRGPAKPIKAQHRSDDNIVKVDDKKVRSHNLNITPQISQTIIKKVQSKQLDPKEVEDQNDGRGSEEEIKSSEGDTNEKRDVISEKENDRQLHEPSNTSGKIMVVQQLGRSGKSSPPTPTLIRHYPHQAIPLVLSSIGQKATLTQSAQTKS